MSSPLSRSSNIDLKTVKGFGEEWTVFDQRQLGHSEREKLFNGYFRIFPWHLISKEKSVGADIGCGSGRWAVLMAERVHILHLVDGSEKALSVAKNNLKNFDNILFHHANVDAIPVADESLDFAYSLGVLHHLPDTENGILDIAKKLKSGAPFLVYLYHAFDGKPIWYRYIWKISDIVRFAVSKMPFKLRYFISQLIAVFVYWPFARIALLFEKITSNIDSWPLSDYRKRSFYVMRNDALDRFGTRLEKRFTKEEIIKMMHNSGFGSVSISDSRPYWCAIGYKK